MKNCPICNTEMKIAKITRTIEIKGTTVQVQEKCYYCEKCEFGKGKLKCSKH